MPLRCPRDQAIVLSERQNWRRHLPRQHTHTSAIHDLAFMRDARCGVRPHLRDGEREAKFIAELDPVEEQDIVHERTHGVFPGHGRHAEDLGVLVVVHRSDLVLFHQHHQGVKEVPKQARGRPER
jgi:hypothetical protein